MYVRSSSNPGLELWAQVCHSRPLYQKYVQPPHFHLPPLPIWLKKAFAGNVHQEGSPSCTDCKPPAWKVDGSRVPALGPGWHRCKMWRHLHFRAFTEIKSPGTHHTRHELGMERMNINSGLQQLSTQPCLWCPKLHSYTKLALKSWLIVWWFEPAVCNMLLRLRACCGLNPRWLCSSTAGLCTGGKVGTSTNIYSIFRENIKAEDFIGLNRSK